MYANRQTLNFLMTLFGVLKGLAAEQWVAEKFTIHGVSLVCLWHITLLKNHLDSCTNASKTLSPSLELVSKNVALCSRASFSPFSEVTHLHPWSMRSERKSSLLPHNMIGILFSDTSCKNDKKYILKKNSWNWNPSHLGPSIRMTYSRMRYWFKDFDSIPRRNG